MNNWNLYLKQRGQAVGQDSRHGWINSPERILETCKEEYILDVRKFRGKMKTTRSQAESEVVKEIKSKTSLAIQIEKKSRKIKAKWQYITWRVVYRWSSVNASKNRWILCRSLEQKRQALLQTRVKNWKLPMTEKTQREQCAHASKVK